MNRLPAREDVIWDDDFDIKGYEEMRNYLKTTSLQARPLPENSMEYISDMGILFQRYVTGETDLDEFCKMMHKLVDESMIETEEP